MDRSLGLLRSLFIYWRPGRQRGLRRLYGQFVGPGDLVFDVGAHLGDRTAALASLGAQVVALEPQPHLATWLSRLVGHRPQVEIRVEAVGRTVGREQLSLSDRNPTVSTLADDWRTDIARENPTFRRVRWERSVEVTVTTLDTLIQEYGTPRFCKIDVEGYEAEVLAGLSTPIESLSVEFVGGALEVASACVRRLGELGEYQYNAVGGEGRRFLFASWAETEETLAWLHAGADGLSSGDLFARRIDSPGENAGGTA